MSSKTHEERVAEIREAARNDAWNVSREEIEGGIRDLREILKDVNRGRIVEASLDRLDGAMDKLDWIRAHVAFIEELAARP